MKETFQVPCRSVVSEYLATVNNNTFEGFVKEYCTNLLDEMLSSQRNARQLARMNHYQKDLLMEQVFTCGQLGFVEICSLHILVAVLSWQDSESGCYMKEPLETQLRLNNQPSMIPPNAHNSFTSRKILSDVIHDGPWPEYFLADQPVVVQNIAAEDRFHEYKYARWVRDSLPMQIHRSRPPQLGWSLDLLAYLSLILLICSISFISQFVCKRRVKQIYHFAYKNL
ncbi:unnamed protein product [Anisakis simplex]|uniref:ERVV2 protein n=1 Tax=Anisakis simplex TaxID=6269 RepID=A0A0M3KGY2_ANISI|nr:unnamed protein product [Anisakis simplex]